MLWEAFLYFFFEFFFFKTYCALMRSCALGGILEIESHAGARGQGAGGKGQGAGCRVQGVGCGLWAVGCSV